MKKSIYPLARTCLHCKNEFIIQTSSSKNRKYCSYLCSTKKIYTKEQREIISKKYQGINNPNYSPNTYTYLKCKECDEQFKIDYSSLKNKKHLGIFCSKKCNYNFKAKNKISFNQDKLNRLFRRMISSLIKNRHKNYVSKWLNLVDYSSQEFINHFESLFQEGMSWENYGEWHVDHIKPVSYFSFSNEGYEELKKCWSLSNLQPLWAKDNLSKGGNNTQLNKNLYN